MPTPGEQFHVDPQVTKLVGYLMGRWVDEHEYEDIQQYAIPLQPLADRHGLEIIRIKAPQGANSIEFTAQTTLGDVVYKFTVNRRGTFSYRRIA